MRKREQRANEVKVLKTYETGYKRKGWTVDVLKCGHAYISEPSAAKGVEFRVCRACLAISKARAAEEVKVAPKVKPMTLTALIKHYGPDSVLRALVTREKKMQALEKGRRIRWAKHRTNGAAPNAAETALAVAQ